MMLRGNLTEINKRITGLAMDSLKSAYQEDHVVGWESPSNAKILGLIGAAALRMNDCVSKESLDAKAGGQVEYVKGRLPNVEIQAMVKVAQDLFDSLYPDSTKIANRKARAFKSEFTRAIKALADRWNNDAKAYYPNGRLRKTDAASTGDAGGTAKGA